MSQPGLTCKPHDHRNYETFKPSLIKKLNSQPI